MGYHHILMENDGTWMIQQDIPRFSAGRWRIGLLTSANVHAVSRGGAGGGADKLSFISCVVFK